MAKGKLIRARVPQAFGQRRADDSIEYLIPLVAAREVPPSERRITQNPLYKAEASIKRAADSLDRIGEIQAAFDDLALVERLADGEPDWPCDREPQPGEKLLGQPANVYRPELVAVGTSTHELTEQDRPPHLLKEPLWLRMAGQKRSQALS